MGRSADVAGPARKLAVCGHASHIYIYIYIVDMYVLVCMWLYVQGLSRGPSAGYLGKKNSPRDVTGAQRHKRASSVPGTVAWPSIPKALALAGLLPLSLLVLVVFIIIVVSLLVLLSASLS